MGARICSWKSEIKVAVGDVGEFTLHVRRLGRDARAEVGEFADHLPDEVEDPKDVLEILQTFRRQTLGMIHAVAGLEFEWAPEEVEAVETGEALLTALERLDPNRYPQWLADVWRACWQEQWMPPFSGALSACTPDSRGGSPGSMQSRSRGGTRGRAKRAKRPTSAQRGDAATTTTDRSSGAAAPE